jgi:hypothetical protein
MPTRSMKLTWIRMGRFSDLRSGARKYALN